MIRQKKSFRCDFQERNVKFFALILDVTSHVRISFVNIFYTNFDIKGNSIFNSSLKIAKVPQGSMK